MLKRMNIIKIRVASTIQKVLITQIARFLIYCNKKHYFKQDILNPWLI